MQQSKPPRVVYTMVPVYLAIALVAILGILRSRNRYPLPPGPKGRWLLGMTLDMPKGKPWEYLADWAQ
jgi:hypothetical protein